MTLVVDDYDDGIAFFVGVLGFDLVADEPATTARSTGTCWTIPRTAASPSWCAA